MSGYMLHVTGYMLHVTCQLTCYMSGYMLQVTCYMLQKKRIPMKTS